MHTLVSGGTSKVAVHTVCSQWSFMLQDDVQYISKRDPAESDMHTTWTNGTVMCSSTLSREYIYSILYAEHAKYH